MPRRPSEKNNATPPTTGGNTIESMHNARTTARPGNSTRASNHARGTPNTIEIKVAQSEQINDKRSAMSALWSVRYRHACDHGALHNRPKSGNAKKRTASAASANTGTGSGVRLSRC